MKIAVLLLSVVQLFCFSANAEKYWFSKVTPSKSISDSRASESERKQAIIDYFSVREIPQVPTPPKERFGEFAGTILSRMAKRIDLDLVNQAILDPDLKPWRVGTDFEGLGPICSRVGDYDFVLMSFLKIIELDNQAGRTLLSKPARKKLLEILLSQSGDEHYEKFKLKNCPPIAITDTENHILMTETARYLTNQFYLQDNPSLAGSKFDNAANGFNDWMARHLVDFLKQDFSEFNSRPYQGFTIIALNHLQSMAKSPRVQVMAEMILDYIVGKYAVQSVNLRRWGPFRRQLAYLNGPHLVSGDTIIGWAIINIGNFESLVSGADQTASKLPPSEYFALMAAFSNYKVPDSILQKFFVRDQETFHIFKHRDIEIYDSSRSFVIAAGGRHRNLADFGTKQNDAQAVATTVIPVSGESTLRSLFRIEGHNISKYRNNLCVAKGFACGLNVEVPDSLPADCKPVLAEGFEFYNLKDCSLGWNFYLALKRKSIGKKYARNIGFLEVREPEIQFQDFVQYVSSNNKSELSEGFNYYTSSRGEVIGFNLVAVPGEDPIFQPKRDLTTSSAPLVTGNFMNQPRVGLIEIKNPSLCETLSLDFTNPLTPHKAINRNCRQSFPHVY